MPIQNFIIEPVARDLAEQLQRKVDDKTKPRGALGKLETLAVHIGLIQNTLTPLLHRPVMMIFAADHGIVAEQVSPFAQAVTQQMVYNFLNGGAAINIFADQHGFELRVIDAGVNHDFAPHPALIAAKIAHGTRNFLHQPAMSIEHCEQAIASGARLVRKELENGSNVLAFGEMGIGNTSAAAALMCVLLGIPAEHCVGRGTGLDEAGLAHKRAIIAHATSKHCVGNDPMSALATFGGFEIAMLVGAMLQGATARAVLLIDGFVVSAALLVASRLQPALLDYCVFAHQSDERGHGRLLQHFAADPLLHLEMRLGEGTGAAVCYPLLVTAVRFLNEMASFDAASVSRDIRR